MTFTEKEKRLMAEQGWSDFKVILVKGFKRKLDNLEWWYKKVRKSTPLTTNKTDYDDLLEEAENGFKAIRRLLLVLQGASIDSIYDDDILPYEERKEDEHDDDHRKD